MDTTNPKDLYLIYYPYLNVANWLNIALYCDFLFNVGNGTQGFVNAEHTLSH